MEEDPDNYIRSGLRATPPRRKDHTDIDSFITGTSPLHDRCVPEDNGVVIELQCGAWLNPSTRMRMHITLTGGQFKFAQLNFFHLPLVHCQSLDQHWLCNEYHLTFDGFLSDNQLIPHIRHTLHELSLDDGCINAGRGYVYRQ